MDFRERLDKGVLWIKKHKKAVIIAAALAALVIFFFGTQVVLFFNFVLGKDLVVKLDAGATSFSVARGEKSVVTFQASVFTNPFCSAVCSYEFLDVSRGKIIGSDVFVMKAGSPFEKPFPISVSRFGSGQELYRFDMDCYSRRSALCHTSERNTSRSVLVTVNYNLSGDEALLKDRLGEMMGLFSVNVERLRRLQGSVAEEKALLEEFVILDNTTKTESSIEAGFEEVSLQFDGLNSLWQSQNYYALDESFPAAELSAAKLQERLSALNESIAANATLFNSLAGSLAASRSALSGLSKMFITNESLSLQIETAIMSFNNASALMANKTALAGKEKAVLSVASVAERTDSLAREQARVESVSRKAALGVEYDSICSVVSYCLPHSPVSEISFQEDFDLKDVCGEVSSLRELYAELNSSLKEAFESQQYPEWQVFWGNASLMADNVRQNITNAYADSVPDGSPNGEFMKSFLVRKALKETQEYPGYNMTPAIFAELAAGMPEGCSAVNATMTELALLPAEKIAVRMNETFAKAIFKEPPPQCCGFGA